MVQCNIYKENSDYLINIEFGATGSSADHSNIGLTLLSGVFVALVDVWH